MSTEEQDAALLRLVRRRSEAKRKKSLIESELREAGRKLSDVGGLLRHVGDSGTGTDRPEYALSEVRKAPEICGLSRIEAMLSELKSLNEELEGLNRAARECGVD